MLVGLGGGTALLWLLAAVVGAETFFSGSGLAVAFLLAGLVAVVVRAGPRRLLQRLTRSILLAAAVGPLPQPVAPDAAVLSSLFLFFIKAGAFVFGSGLAIVPFLHQGVVVENGWLTERQFLDAVAVGLITPGPVVITAAFVGFLVAGLPGAAVASLGVFLPAYLLVVVPGRWILRPNGLPHRAGVRGRHQRRRGGSDRCCGDHPRPAGNCRCAHSRNRARRARITARHSALGATDRTGI